MRRYVLLCCVPAIVVACTSHGLQEVDLDRHGALRRFSSLEGAADTWRDLD